MKLSPSGHNQLQAAVIQEFAPRFAGRARVLYVGDTSQKTLHLDAGLLEALGIPVNAHDKLPDIVLYVEDRNWLFLIEAVTSHGPMSPKRVTELRKMLKRSSAGPIFITAFPSLTELRKHLRNIAWETEIWIAEMPDHLIHFNGDRFLGPR